MQQITRLMREAFLEARPFRRVNTRVEVTNYNVSIYLYDNKIASRRIGAGLLFDTIKQNEITISNCGWFTTTTKDRLNALPNVHINQKQGVWYLNGEQWDGRNINVQMV